MSDGVLPALLVFPVIRKVAHYVFVDSVESQTFLRTVPDGHHDQGVVAVRWFLFALLLFVVFAFLRAFRTV